MKIFRFLMSAVAILTSPAALAEDVAPPAGTETITTTKTIGRVEEDGTTKPVEKEIKTETLIDIPIKKEIIPGQTVPCKDLPPIVAPSEEFIEHNEDDDSDIEAEVEGEVLINDKGEIGYALDEVPAELLEENPIYPINNNVKSAEVIDRETIREVENAVDEALDDEEIEAIQNSRGKQVLTPTASPVIEHPKPAPRVIDPKNDVTDTLVKP